MDMDENKESIKHLNTLHKHHMRIKLVTCRYFTMYQIKKRQYICEPEKHQQQKCYDPLKI